MLAAVTFALGMSAANGAILHVDATQDPDAVSEFTLDFGFGIRSSAAITQTKYRLQIDETTNSAALLQYDQDVDSLTLPGGIPTGAIKVKVLPGSSSGTYDPGTGEFTTSEIYVIWFAGDLSAFGLTSPVYLPGESTGVMSPTSPVAGTIESEWVGDGFLPNAQDPENPIAFSYNCRVNTKYGQAPACIGDANGDRTVDNEDLQIMLNSWASNFGEEDFSDEADLNFDGAVNNSDLQEVIDNWARECE
jgi:hypothetical protein